MSNKLKLLTELIQLNDANDEWKVNVKTEKCDSTDDKWTESAINTKNSVNNSFERDLYDNYRNNYDKTGLNGVNNALTDDEMSTNFSFCDNDVNAVDFKKLFDDTFHLNIDKYLERRQMNGQMIYCCKFSDCVYSTQEITLFINHFRSHSGSEVNISGAEMMSSDNALNMFMNYSQSSETVKRKSVGRNPENKIHTYFDYNIEIDKSKCIVNNCNKELKGKKTSNLVSHLRSFHKLEYQIFSQNESERKAKKLNTESTVTTPPLTINHAFIAPNIRFKKYDKKDPVIEGFMSRLVKLFSSTSIPMSLVEQQEFRDLIWFMDDKISLPSSKGLFNECLKYINEAKQEIISKIGNTDAITIGADIWNKKGLLESYIGLTAYFYDRNKDLKYVLTLGLKPFPFPHRADSIRDEIKSIIQEYKINSEKIFRVITDNGSYVVKTFKIEWSDKIECDDGECDSDDIIDIDQYIEDMEDECDMNEFDTEEASLDLEFSETKLKRISSILCVLQCVIAVCNKSSPYKLVLKSALILIKRLRLLGKLEKLKTNKTSSDMSTITPTRWSVVFANIFNIIEKRCEINRICVEENLDNLETSEWELIQEFANLYKPFNDICNEMSRDFETTISKVSSSILFLRHHLTVFINKGSNSAIICSKNLLKELNDRFDPLLNPDNEKFSDGIYIASTFLDPRYARSLNEVQRNHAKTFIRNYTQEIDKTITSCNDTEKPFESYNVLSSLESFMETEFSDIPAKAVDIIDFDKQMINWLHFISNHRISFKTEALDFWRKDISTANFIGLKNIALNILCTPSSTATIDRVLAAAGNACLDNRSRLSDKRLEMIVFLKNNAKYLNALNSLK